MLDTWHTLIFNLYLHIFVFNTIMDVGGDILKPFTAKHQRICKLCGDSFLPETRHQMYCKKVHTYKCVICGKDFPIPNSIQHKKCCSMNCTQQLKKIAYMEHYGVDNPAKSKEVQKKFEQTCIEKYGVRTPLLMDGFAEKYKATCLDRYGVENPGYSPEVQAKRRATCLERFGEEEPLRLKRVKSALKQVYSDPNRVVDIFSKRLKSSKCVASDGTKFDSKYEVDVYEFCIANSIPITDRTIPIHYTDGGEDHITYVDFEIDGILFECKGGHLLRGCFDYAKNIVPIDTKLSVYDSNGVVLITDYLGKEIFETSENPVFKHIVGFDIECIRALSKSLVTDSDCRVFWSALKEIIHKSHGFISTDILLNSLK